MRYNVGEAYPFVRTYFDCKSEDGRYVALFHPEYHRNPVVDVKMLEVTEHHKVPVEYYEDRDKTVDGFVLREVGTQERWVNQYPKASYGQLDTSGDLRARRSDGLTNEEFDRLSEHEKDQYVERWRNHYTDALSFVEEIERALVGRNPIDFGQYRAEFESYRDAVKNAIEKATGKKIAFRDQEIELKTGEQHVIPGFVEAYYA